MTEAGYPIKSSFHVFNKHASSHKSIPSRQEIQPSLYFSKSSYDDTDSQVPIPQTTERNPKESQMPNRALLTTKARKQFGTSNIPSLRSDMYVHKGPKSDGRSQPMM